MTENWFKDQLLLNAGQKYCRRLQGEHSAILSTFIKLPFVIKTFVLSIFEWVFYIGFIVWSEIKFMVTCNAISAHIWDSILCQMDI